MGTLRKDHDARYVLVEFKNYESDEIGDDTILSMVRAGMGSAVLPWLVVHGPDVQSDDRLRVHELRPALPAECRRRCRR